MTKATTEYTYHILAGLDDEKSPLALDGPVMIVADAGSSKTPVLSASVGLPLDRKVAPESFVCVTFTAKVSAVTDSAEATQRRNRPGQQRISVHQR